MWEILATSYQGMTKVNIVMLHNTIREFECPQMKETKNINSFMNYILIIVNELNIYGDNIKYQTMLENSLELCLLDFMW